MRQTTVDLHLRPHWPATYVPRKTAGEGDGELAVVCEEGDYKVVFDPTQREEVEVAKTSFDALRKQGFLAFKVVGKDGAKGEQIHDFDPKAGKILMTPPMRGGC